MNKLILVVDDEDDARIFLYSLLEAEGYRVATCADAFEALKFIARQRPDLVISDVRMPGMEGLELLSKIREASPDTKVILLSAYADWPMFFEAMERGGQEVMLKPFHNEDLLRAVGNVLQEAV